MVNITDGIKFILIHLEVNGKESTLDLLAYQIWNLYLDAKLIFDLSNKYYLDNHRLYRTKKLSTWTDSKKNIFKVE